VRYKGECFIIERNGEPVAEITPVEARQAATLADLFRLLRETGFPDEEFANDLEAIHASQEKVLPPAWPS
jgi:antitoxin (DNA-binding transcriptional repressor) of toxin-antitoxin stability system